MQYRTKDHPQANGRLALRGEKQWVFTFPLEDGTELKVLAGRVCRDSFKAMLEQEEIDDLAESNPTKGQVLGDARERQEADPRRELESTVPPVDRSARTLTDGSPVSDDHREINPASGQQKGYVVLSAEERAKGFVRPVRKAYTHVGKLTEMEGGDGSTFTQRLGGCGAETIMGTAIAETYARDPKFYSGTFCARCAKHLPLNEFVWSGTDEEVGS